MWISKKRIKDLEGKVTAARRDIERLQKRAAQVMDMSKRLSSRVTGLETCRSRTLEVCDLDDPTGHSYVEVNWVVSALLDALDFEPMLQPSAAAEIIMVPKETGEPVNGDS